MRADRLFLLTVPLAIVAGLLLAAAYLRLGAVVATIAWLAAATLLAALSFPYLVCLVALVLGVFAAAYLEPVPPMSGPVLLSILIFMSGVGVTLRLRGRSFGRPLALVGMGLGCTWLLGSILGGRPTEGVALTGFAVMAGAIQLGQTEKGRGVILRGLAIGAAVASCYGLMAAFTGWNPVLEVGLRVGGAISLGDIPMRFGYSRAVGAFTHPIMLGVFLGLGCLAALELGRSGIWRERVSVLVVVICFAGQIATISRGPITITLGLVAIWFLLGRDMSMRWRVTGVIAVLVLVVGALAAIGIMGDVGTLFGTSSNDPLANSTQYRLDLVSALVRRIPTAPILGFADPESAVFLPGFRSLDNEVAYLGATRGLFGLAVYSLMLLLPLVACAARQGVLAVSRRYVVLTLVLLTACGITVAYFGLLMPYLFIAVGLCWSVVAAPPADADDRESRPG